jgi:hypothetical protein
VPLDIVQDLFDFKKLFSIMMNFNSKEASKVEVLNKYRVINIHFRAYRVD